MSAIVGAGLCACPNGGNHRGLPLQKMADLMIKPSNLNTSVMLFCSLPIINTKKTGGKKI